MTTSATVLSGYLSRFPNTATKTLAILAYKENKALWSNLEACRTAIRRLRGASGSKALSKLKNQEFLREKGASGDPFGKLPEPLREFNEEWGAVIIPAPAKCLVLSDVHIPFYDKRALITALNYGIHRGADTVVLIGDIADCFAVSFWEKDPRKRDFPGEIKAVREFLGVVRNLFKKARIVFKFGNHEDRYERYMKVKAPELLGVEAFELGSLLQLDHFGMIEVKDNRPIRLGKLNMIHGHEYQFAISNPVNPARGLFLRGKAHSLCGHFHQSSQHSEKTLEQKVLSTWSLGALCDLHPSYRPINNWSHGFAFAEVDKDGVFSVQNLRIVNGVAY
jgi:predicted phosphodiesterase